MNTTNAPSGLPLSGSALADGGAEGGLSSPTTETNYPFGFGYARSAIRFAIGRLEAHQYKAALDYLHRDLDFLDRMKAGWDPEEER